jgi:single-strand DNA-binding protein
MNKTMLIGNLGKDPDMKYTEGGTAVTTFSVAVNRFSKSPSGERVKETDWFDVVAWDRLAETCDEHLRKGTKVYVEGRLQKRKYTGRDEIEHTVVELVLKDMEILTPKGQGHSREDGGSLDDLEGLDE